MTKRDQLHEWLMLIGDWVYLSEIDHERFGMSKKAWKKAVGTLYKARKIDITPNGIRLEM